MGTLTGILRVERRVHPRAEVSVRVALSIEGSVVEAQSVDVSARGMQLTTSASTDVGTRLVLHFGLPDQNVAYRVDGEVTWCTQSAGDGTLYAWGVRFIKPSRVTMAGIKLLLAELEPEAGQAPAEEKQELPEALPVAEQTPEDGPEAWSADLQASILSENMTHARHLGQAHELYEQAVATFAANDLGQARQLLQRALVLAPHSREIVEELARVCYQQGDVVRAAELFDRAMQLELESK